MLMVMTSNFTNDDYTCRVVVVITATEWDVKLYYTIPAISLVSCCSTVHIGLMSWYLLTQVVLETTGHYIIALPLITPTDIFILRIFVLMVVLTADKFNFHQFHGTCSTTYVADDLTANN